LKTLQTFFFDYEEEDKTPLIKEEIKEEIKTEPLVEDNIDDENLVIDVENDQEKSDLQAMVDKLLLEKQTLKKDMDKLVELQVGNQILKSDKKNLERQLEDKGKKFAELQLENQNLKSDKDYLERQFEDKVKGLQVKNQMSREQLQLNSNPIVPLKKIEKFNVAQNLEIPEEVPVGFPSEDEEINFSDPEVSSNCSNSGANQVAFEELIIPNSSNDNPEENKKKVKKHHHSTKSDGNIINKKRTSRSTRKLIRYNEDQLDDISSDSGSDKNYCPTKDRTEDETENDEVSDMEDLQNKTNQTTKMLNSKVTPKDKKYQVNRKHNHSSQRKTANGKQKNYKCEICGKKFGQKTNLNTHVKTVHEKQRNYKCKICGKEFGFKHNVNRHIITVHEKQRDYKCTNCGKEFGQKVTLSDHISSIHKKKGKYKCDYCSKTFPRKYFKEKHEKRIHNTM